MMPKTKMGRWAGGFLAVFLVFFIALILGSNLLNIAPGTPLIVMVGICATIFGIAAFVTGVISLIKFKDRSFIVILAVVIGFIASLLMIMEVVEGFGWSLTH